MTVSVLLTSYNAGELLPGAIASVEGQTYHDWDLTILDDGSSDPRVPETLAAAERAGHRVCRFHPSRFQRWRSVRYATLINSAARVTDGALLTYLCSDDYFLPDRLERMVAKIEQGAEVVYGPQALLDEDGIQFGVRATDGVLDYAYERVDLNSVLQTRASFEAVGGFPTDRRLWRNADAHMWQRLTTAGYRFVPVDGDAPTDAKRYRRDGVDARVIAGKPPW